MNFLDKKELKTILIALVIFLGLPYLIDKVFSFQGAYGGWDTALIFIPLVVMLGIFIALKSIFFDKENKEKLLGSSGVQEALLSKEIVSAKKSMPLLTKIFLFILATFIANFGLRMIFQH